MIPLLMACYISHTHCVIGSSSKLLFLSLDDSRILEGEFSTRCLVSTTMYVAKWYSLSLSAVSASAASNL